MRVSPHFVTILAAPLLLSSPTAAASCILNPVSGLTFSPDYSTVSVLFQDFTASVGDPASCLGSAPTDPLHIDVTNGGANPIPAGTVIAYSADYRGSLDGNSTASIRTVNGGRQTRDTLVSTDAVPPPGNVVLSDFAGASNGVLRSDIYLAMLSYDDPQNQFSLETIDYTELARTTTTDIQTSVDQLSTAHTSLITRLNATGDLLTGAGQKFEQDDGVAALGSVGSFTLGATGRRSLEGGFTLLGGAAVFNQSVGGASASGLLFSGSLRYVEPSGGLVRPYGELGLVTAPLMGLSFTRSYVTSIGTTTTTGTATGGLYGGFIKGGVLLVPDENNEVVASATVSKDWPLTGAYSETFSGSNLFAASAPAQTNSFDTAKIGVDWTTKVMSRVDVTLSGAVGATIADNPVATDVMFAGAFSGAPRSELFGEYGARVAYEIDPSQSISAFIHGSMGQYSGSHVQVGGDFHDRF